MCVVPGKKLHSIKGKRAIEKNGTHNCAYWKFFRKTPLDDVISQIDIKKRKRWKEYAD